MNLVVLGLTISSSWGNGHATTWRALLRSLNLRGHQITFLEREQPWYRSRRDLWEPDYCNLIFYNHPDDLRQKHASLLSGADVVLGSSYVPDGIVVSEIILELANGVTGFYDIDTPITLAALQKQSCVYVSIEQIASFDFYFSFSGGRALEILSDYGALQPVPLYCSVDPSEYFYDPQEPTWDLGYMGTYSADRQPSLENFLVRPAQQLSGGRFVVAGSQFPEQSWPENVSRIEHLPPDRHRSFYNSQACTLNVTRTDMRRLGCSPSVRLFEAAACGTPIVTDDWDGLENFFERDEEIFVVQQTSDVVEILSGTSEESRRALGLRAMEKVLRWHTADHRAAEFEACLGLSPIRAGILEESRL